MEGLSRKCKTCGNVKPLTEFYARVQAEGTFYRPTCKECMSEAAKRRYHEDPEWRAGKRQANKNWQDRNPGYRPAYGKAYYERRREYYAERNKAWARAHRDRRVAIRRKNVYGITQAEFDALLAAQSGRCAICGTDLHPGKWAIDHDHETGRVRGILCRSCNIMLGLAMDDQSILAKAIKYLHEKELQTKT